ncbi:GPN3 [Hepatospora eriocheir]|uniref:GPN-loop GTPase 3 n=1 Tax=Hepatospora eriocheir TaxID=1081669 RepID=A0A1X0QFZ4_9MICR|nr:GPN3 [Hepatospora eriocheir]
MSTSIILVFGAAGAGKTTFCKKMKESLNYKLINIDPAQESQSNNITYDHDIVDYITVDEVMNEMDFGPNGGLFECLRQMVEALNEPSDFMNSLIEDDIYVVDCPGQIELFLHSEVMIDLIEFFKSKTQNILITYLIESSNFENDKILYSSLCSSISLSRFYLPVINILSKADQLKEEIDFDRIYSIEEFIKGKKTKFIQTCIDFVDMNGYGSYLPLNWTEPSSINLLSSQIDIILQRDDQIDNKN